MNSIYQPHYPNEPDWAADEEILYSHCCIAIERFAKEHPDEICSFLAFDSEPAYGYVLIALDTRDNEMEESNRRQEYEVKTVSNSSRERTLGRVRIIISARYKVMRTASRAAVSPMHNMRKCSSRNGKDL